MNIFDISKGDPRHFKDRFWP